jgi:hypothetical protein
MRERRPILVSKSAGHFLCWYCSKQLPSEFTTVEKNGEALRVHLECRVPAVRAISNPLAVDFERLPC